jgi:hypothetical protein
MFFNLKIGFGFTQNVGVKHKGKALIKVHNKKYENWMEFEGIPERGFAISNLVNFIKRIIILQLIQKQSIPKNIMPRYKQRNIG